ncbi:MAG TPA: hypothetical protein VFJ22_06825 [Dermatophilaceae bacterium]|jgi:hypothetical protein|nr:hypothetical protein [Dermatophilaceae bacterium]
MQDILKSGISRRTVVKGAAWSVPAVVVAGAAPAYAATPIVTIGVGLACKHPGAGDEKHYHFELTVTNNGGATTTVTISEITLVPTSGQTVTFTEPAPFDVAAHSSECIVVDSDITANSSNGTLLVSYDFTLEGGGTGHFEAAIDVGSLPPCQPQGVPDYPHPGYTC